MEYADDDFAALLGDTHTAELESGGASPADNASVALDLARRGFAVLPIRDWGDGEGWKPVKGYPDKASSDVERVRRWWADWPEARVGLLADKRNGVTVLDIDVKNGKDGFAAMAKLGFGDLAALSPVRVRTPSGGLHLYFQHEPRLKNSASKIGDGIDVKSRRNYVVAPGSLKDGCRYEPIGAPLGTVELPPFPESLIPPPEPEREPVEPLAEATEFHRKWAADHLQNLADKLAATGEGSRNVTLNNAAMWAGGVAIHGFLTREQALNALSTAATAAGLRKGAIRDTFKSGFNAGLEKPISDFPRETSADEFDDDELETLDGDGETTASERSAKDSVTARLNRRHAVVVVRGRTLITTERKGGSVDFGTVRDIHAFYENDRVPAGDGKREPASRRWMRDPGRRSFPNGVTFAPDGCEPGTLNLWRGWAVEPDPNASCERFLQHVRTIICRGDAGHAAYVLGWLAHMVQRPGEKPGVALVLKGAKGAGKDTLAEYVARMIGRRHAPTVAEASHVVGKFNARLENALLLHVQEGSWAGDRKAEGVLKYLVTSDHIEIERKGIDSINLPSVLRIFISANADWVVPASPDERRWAVFEVSERRRGDTDYFAALRSEMEGKGPAALLHYLQNYDLSGFNVRAAPETEGLRNQKIASLRGLELWWFETLCRATLGAGFDDSDDWAAKPQEINRDALRSRYAEWLKGRRYDGNPVDGRLFGKRLREMMPAIEDRRVGKGSGTSRAWQYVLPVLTECRAAFDAWIGAPVDWDAAH